MRHITVRTRCCQDYSCSTVGGSLNGHLDYIVLISVVEVVNEWFSGTPELLICVFFYATFYGLVRNFYIKW